MDRLPVACNSCSRSRPDSGNKCDAYPSGIPADILLFGIDPHTQLRGDEEVALTYDADPAKKLERDAYLHVLRVPMPAPPE